MSNKNKSTKGKWSQVQDWYAGPKVQMYVGNIYSLGAAVVIVGALFKLMHWPGAGTMLTIGMITEAILFTIGIFEKPHTTYHWENVFPPLVGDEVKPINNLGTVINNVNSPQGNDQVNPVVTNNTEINNKPIIANTEINNSSKQFVRQDGPFNENNISVNGVTNIPNIPNIPNINIDDEDAKSLTEGIKAIKDSAQKLANIGKFAEITESYVSNLNNATSVVSELATKQQEFSNVTSNLIDSYNKIAINVSASGTNTRELAECTSNISRSLNAINTAYELQLKEINIQNEQMAALTKSNGNVADNIEKIQQSINESAMNMYAYKQMTEQLSKNISSLNDIYGNMLNAIKE